MKHVLAPMAALLALALASPLALAQKKYDPGATDKEIKVGNINPYSGPASAYGTIGKTIGAYFTKVNEEGGVNGRKINFISVDDGYSPPRTVEMARKLVEQDEVLLLFQPLGTPPNSAIQKYMNSKKVPQLFVATGATKWNDPKNFPWTMGWQPNYQDEAAIYAQHILKTKPNAKIVVLVEHGDLGRRFLFREILRVDARLALVARQPAHGPGKRLRVVPLGGAGGDEQLRHLLAVDVFLDRGVGGGAERAEQQ